MPTSIHGFNGKAPRNALETLTFLSLLLLLHCLPYQALAIEKSHRHVDTLSVLCRQTDRHTHTRRHFFRLMTDRVFPPCPTRRASAAVCEGKKGTRGNVRRGGKLMAYFLNRQAGNYTINTPLTASSCSISPCLHRDCQPASSRRSISFCTRPLVARGR